MTNKTVMITGSTGFIGSWLCETKPAGFDILTPSHDAVDDLCLPRADHIIHAAGYAAPALFTKNPIDTLRVNTDIVGAMFEHFLNPGGSFLFCSSSEVYKGLTYPATENEIGTTTPYHPRACYIEGKRCGETIVNAYRAAGFNAMSARIGLTYGPGTRKHDARVMNQFIEQALTKKRIDLADDGQALVDYGYARDTAKMLWTILLHGTQAVYNVGGMKRIRITDLAREIAYKIGAEVVIPEAPEGLSQVQIDKSRYFKEFGRPEYTSWEDGLDATIAYQRGLYGVV